MPPTLVTIPISHYGERARWALDRSIVAYREQHHLQFFGWIPAFRYGRKKTLPVLVTDDGVLDDSGEIVRFAHERGARLYPEDPARRAEVESLERELVAGFGVETRRVAYDWFFQNLEPCLPYNAGRAPDYQVATLRALRRPASIVARRYLRVRDAEVERGKELVRRTMDAIGARIADGRRYLFGDRFSAADLAFATMAAPALGPAQYAVALPPDELIAPAGLVWMREMRAHPAGVFALRLWEERPTPRGVYDRPLRATQD